MTSGRLRRASGREVVAALQRAGFELESVRGSHYYLIRPPHRLRIPVPVHGNEVLPVGTLGSILRRAGISRDEFAALLRD